MVHSVVFYYTFWMSGADVLPPSALPTAAGAPGALLGEALHVLVNHRLREAVPLIKLFFLFFFFRQVHKCSETILVHSVVFYYTFWMSGAAEKRKTIKKTILNKKDLLLLPETPSRHGSVLPGG